AAAEQAAGREVAEPLLVAGEAVAHAQRQVAEHVLALHERLIADAPEQRGGREDAEAVRGAEPGRAVAPDVEGRRDAVGVRVRKTPEVRREAPVGPRGRAAVDVRRGRDVLA